MSTSPDPPDGGHTLLPGQYEIRVKGHLDARWADWFDGLHLHHESDGTTTICGPIADQSALHGLLRKVRDLGVPLVSVNRIAPDQVPASHRAEGDPSGT